MHLRSVILLFVLLSLWIDESESRKVTQKPKKAAPPPPSPPKKDKSWVRSKIDSAKQKYESGKQKLKSKFSFGSKSDEKKNSIGNSAPKTTPRKQDYQLKTTTKRTYGWNSNAQSNIANSGNPKSDIGNYQQSSMLTTKKPLIDRFKEKAKKSEKYVGKAVGWAKKDLGIGVEGPKKPSKILKYGKKAVEYVFKKKSRRAQNLPVAGYSAGNSYSNGVGYSNGYSGEVRYSSGSSGSYSENYGPENSISPDLHQKVKFLRNRLESMQKAVQGTWNTSEAGTKYKLFEEKKTWNDAQLHCEELGSNLAYLDSESKNNYAKLLIDSHNVTLVWFGLRTETGSDSGTQSQDQFSNFSNLDGCGVVDVNGSWSISSCSIELPYLCQAFRFDVLVEIP